MTERIVEIVHGDHSLAEIAESNKLVTLDHRQGEREGNEEVEIALKTHNLSVYYGDFQAIREVDLDIQRRRITAIIGPSGCGKTTVLRAFNRMNELVPTARTRGEVIFRGDNIYQDHIDPVEVRRRIGMVFQ